jgi:biopolymer transport protein ExbB
MAVVTVVALLAAQAFAPVAEAQNAPAPAATPAAPSPSIPAAAPASPTLSPAPTVTPSVPSAPSALSAPPAAPAGTSVTPIGAVAPSAAPPVAAALPGAAPSEDSSSKVDLAEDLSPWGMFMNADIVVKAVMIGLAFASFVTWTVWLAKTFELNGARRAVRRDLRVLNTAATFAQAHEQLRDRGTAAAQLIQSAGQEVRLSTGLRAEGLKERIALQLERIEMGVSRKISRGTGVLATIGSTAPFVGLFGTVWGIMNSFIGISNAHTTNLAVVAPGIAQALLATAFGLIAAIPAVMIYNVLARQTAHYRANLGDASAQVMRLISRDLDRAKLPMAQAAE